LILTVVKPLTEADVLRVMREEWNARVAHLTEQIDMVMNSKIGKKEGEVLAPELKLKHKESMIRYTVTSVGPRDVILRTPEGENFLVSKEELEDSYILD
jgi:hypothetical protein